MSVTLKTRGLSPGVGGGGGVLAAKLPPVLSGTDRPLHFEGAELRPLKSAFPNTGLTIDMGIHHFLYRVIVFQAFCFYSN